MYLPQTLPQTSPYQATQQQHLPATSCQAGAHNSHSTRCSRACAKPMQQPMASDPQRPPDELYKVLEGQLQEKDAIMEPNVLQLVTKYMQAGGQPAQVVEHLSDGYEGYAQMASLVCGWLQLVDGVAGEEATASTSSAGPGPGSSGTPDEFTFLQELAKERYDVDKFLAVFRRGPPAWLDGLTADKRGRHLVYDLATAHQNCLLLSFAIQRLLKQGYEDEVASRGSSLAYYFGVYHRLLKKLLEDAAEAQTTAALEKVCRELREACTQSQHTYTHAQQLLTALSRQPGGDVLRRLSQEVEAAAVEAHGGAKVWPLQRLFVPQLAPHSQYEAAVLVGDILVACGGSDSVGEGMLKRVEGPLSVLQRLYAQQGTPLEPLRHPVFLDLLLSGVFTQAPALTKEGTTCCLSLLAFSAAAEEVWQEQQPQQQHEEGQAAASGIHRRTFVQLDCSNVRQMEDVLLSAMELAKKALTGAKSASADAKSASADAAQAFKVCETPLAVLGLLHFLRGVLGNAIQYADERFAVCHPAILQLITTCASGQPGLMSEVVSLIGTALLAMGNNDIAKSYLDLLVQLMMAGVTEQVLAVVGEWSATSDPSLVRHFVWQVLDSVEPPYSSVFAHALLRPMLACNINIVRGSDAQRKMVRLREFAQHAAQLHFAPPLTQQEQLLLGQLTGRF